MGRYCPRGDYDHSPSESGVTAAEADAGSISSDLATLRDASPCCNVFELHIPTCTLQRDSGAAGVRASRPSRTRSRTPTTVHLPRPLRISILHKQTSALASTVCTALTHTHRHFQPCFDPINDPLTHYSIYATQRPLTHYAQLYALTHDPPTIYDPLYQTVYYAHYI